MSTDATFARLIQRREDRLRLRSSVASKFSATPKPLSSTVQSRVRSPGRPRLAAEKNKRRAGGWTSSRRSGAARTEHDRCSAHAEIPQDEQHDNDDADKPDDSVHDCIPRTALRVEKRTRLAQRGRSRWRHSMRWPPSLLCAGARRLRPVMLGGLEGLEGLEGSEGSAAAALRGGRLPATA